MMAIVAGGEKYAGKKSYCFHNSKLPQSLKNGLSKIGNLRRWDAESFSEFVDKGADALKAEDSAHLSDGMPLLFQQIESLLEPLFHQILVGSEPEKLFEGGQKVSCGASNSCWCELRRTWRQESTNSSSNNIIHVFKGALSGNWISRVS
jgi:hypothetical protein